MQADRETREFTVDLHVLELPKNWAVGQRAEGYIETGRKTGATVLPSQYVLWRDEQPGVLVREGRRAVWRCLTLGLRGQEIVEVAAGLERAARDRRGQANEVFLSQPALNEQLSRPVAELPAIAAPQLSAVVIRCMAVAIRRSLPCMTPPWRCAAGKSSRCWAPVEDGVIREGSAPGSGGLPRTHRSGDAEVPDPEGVNC